MRENKTPKNGLQSAEQLDEAHLAKKQSENLQLNNSVASAQNIHSLEIPLYYKFKVFYITIVHFLGKD